MWRLALAATAACVLACSAFAHASAPAAHVYVISRVVDGDTVDLTNGAKIRLVQIDTPEVYFGLECWGRQASAETKTLLPPGTKVRLAPEPATDSVDRYDRLLRYVIRARDGLNVNVFLVAHGDAAPTSTAAVRAASRPRWFAWRGEHTPSTAGSGVPVPVPRSGSTTASTPARRRPSDRKRLCDFLHKFLFLLRSKSTCGSR